MLVVKPNEELTLNYLTNPLKLKEIHLELPSSIEYKQSHTGRGVFSTRNFAKYEIIYQALSVVIPNQHETITLHLNRKESPEIEEELLLDTFTHAVELNDSTRELFPYDSFMNHSCKANSMMLYSEFESTAQDNRLEFKHYRMIALCDIATGQEITCNYNLFDYRCHGHSIPLCQCGAVDCCGRVGFSFLPQKDQLSLLPLATKAIKLRFYNDYPTLTSSPKLLEEEKGEYHLKTPSSFFKHLIQQEDDEESQYIE
eukprot:gene3403-3627_t